MDLEERGIGEHFNAKDEAQELPGMPTSVPILPVPTSAENDYLGRVRFSQEKQGDMWSTSKEEYLALLETCVHRTTQSSRQPLDYRLRKSTEGVIGADSGSMFFMSKPFRAAMLKPVFRWVFAGFALNFFGTFAFFSAFLPGNGNTRHPLYRISNLPSNIALGTDNTTIFGLLSGPTPLIVNRTWKGNDSNSVVLEVDPGFLTFGREPYAVSGWFAVLPSTADVESARNAHFSASDDGESWSEIYVPWNVELTSTALDSSSSNTRTRSEEEDGWPHFVRWQLNASPAIIVGRIAADLVAALGFCAALVCSLRKKPAMGALLFGVGFLSSALSSLIGAFLTSDLVVAWKLGLSCVAFGIHGVGLLCFEPHYLHVILLAGIYTLASGSAATPWVMTENLPFVIVGAMQMSLWVLVRVLRQRALTRARSCVQDIQHTYTRVWGELL
eukprot:CAMPEP_0177717252 /NCGR_PEP_ID=MMETSP0484_2-20121128/14936_1 /TAXON_ID=354590 /ORGANISM="Rhodomonas lens, Strain RHODO" /LENGTH=442 /DNA_ID=CAMNT_0019229321 /DNA_START=108 /DNA_END=1432 /DNA_ORIENTATION=+